jgi:hypothetical protein
VRRISPFKTFSVSGEASHQILTLFAVIAGIYAIGTVGYYISGLHGSFPFPQDQAGYVLGRVFLNTWFYGKAAFLSDPGRFYDHDVYARWINEGVPQDASGHVWSYPPSFLFIAAPFGLLSYPVALAVWTGTGLTALYAVVRNHALQTIAILGSPAALFCLIDGQVSFFMAAITLTALRNLDRRPILSGLLVALCTIKPQTGLLFPVLLIASRRWRVLAAAVLGTAAIVLASSLLWGFYIWRDYVHIGLPAQIADTKETHEGLTPWSPTMMTAMIMAGLEPNLTTAIQLAFTGLAAIFVTIGCARGPMNERRTALFLACSVFAAPYLLAHDLVALTAAVVMLAAAQSLDRWGSLAVKAVFLLPLLQFAAGVAHVPGAAAIPVCFAFWALRQRDAMPAAPMQAAAIAP